MNLLPASFKGVKLHVDTACQKLEFRHQSYEFISKHEPTTEIFAKTPNEYTFEGFIIGRDALLTKDLLYTACADSSAGVIFHPLLGFKRAVCVALKIEEILECASAYAFSLQCKEVSDAPDAGLINQALSKIDEAHAAINRYALTFNQELAVLTQTAYGFKRAVDALVKLDSFLTSQNGMGLFSATYGQVKNSVRQAKEILSSPHGTAQLLCKAIRRDKVRVAILKHVQADSLLTTGAVIFSLLHHQADDKGEVPLAPVAKAVLPDVKDPQIFAALWDISISEKPAFAVPACDTFGDDPSLVASFKRFGNLNHSEELAHGAKQPFAV